MFGKATVRDLITRSAETDDDRRKFLKAAGATGFGVVGASLLGGGLTQAAEAAGKNKADAPSDGSVLNFALNLEYLEAEFYHRAYFGRGLPDKITDGKGGRGPVAGGRAVTWSTKQVKQIAHEITIDELNHVEFLRSALGASKVGRPRINLSGSFQAAAEAAGLVKGGQRFDPYANEENFLLAAFIFEDVGVTAYKGAAPLISNKTYLEAAAGILAVEAYHAATLRTLLLGKGLGGAANAISNARDALDGNGQRDQGPFLRGRINITPTDSNSIAFSRTTGQVLNVVYLTPKKATKGGFFPAGVNGSINTSGGS